MKFIGYVRVSKAEMARDGVSLDLQEERIRAYADFVGGEVVDIVSDHKTGKNLKRDGIHDAVERVVSGEADALVVFAIDRLARNTVDTLDIVDSLSRAGKGFVSVREQLDSNTPHGRFTLTVIGAVAQMERDLIASRTKEALDQLRRDGKPTGPTAYGWRVGPEGKVIEDMDEKHTLVFVLHHRKDGRSFQKIANMLNAMGIKTRHGREWKGHNVKKMVSTYIKKGGSR